MIHLVFDILAIVLASTFSYYFRRKYQLNFIHNPNITGELKYYYQTTLLLGLIIGSIFFGSLNMQLSGVEGFGKSMLGGVFGAVLFAEVFKYFAKIKTSTGLVFIPMLAILIIIGRLGCFATGLDDYTYGVQTTLPWGFDFGDGINRHPVQLYESLALLLFITLFLYQYPKNKIFWHQNGFYVFIIFYASQRFIWEFLKPYEQVFGAFNLFHILTILLIVYATIFLTKIKNIGVND